MSKSVLSFLLGTALVVMGCQNEDDFKKFEDADVKPPDPQHVHPTEGPHKGSLIELGNEEYHAEFLDNDETGEVTIYILDDHAENMVPIEATEVIINLKHEDKPLQFTLKASPDASDPEGKSSRFVLADKELVEHLDAEGTEPSLRVTIKGKQFTGDIEHSHEDE